MEGGREKGKGRERKRAKRGEGQTPRAVNILATALIDSGGDRQTVGGGA